MGRKRKPENEKAVSKTELLTAIHKYCLQCSGNVRAEVERCRVANCELYKYRNPKACNMSGSVMSDDSQNYEQIDIFEAEKDCNEDTDQQEE